MEINKETEGALLKVNGQKQMFLTKATDSVNYLTLTN